MSADPIVRQSGNTASRLGEALYFDAADHRLFGWLHRPCEKPSTGLGMVICKPFGYEAICAHRSLRAFAEEAAEMGVPTLRFDYLGTGDSAEIHPEANQLAIWAQDIVAAVAELQRLTGVERVCLLGVRLGALLATLAASQCESVSALILIAPVVSGRRYLREVRTMVLAGSLGEDTAEQAPKEFISAPPGSVEVGGFSFSAATLSALALVDLNGGTGPSDCDILLIDGDLQPTSRGWADHLARTGNRAQHLALPGLVEMVMTAPQFATIPSQMIAVVQQWLAARLPVTEVPPIPQAGQSPADAVMNLPANGELADMLERPVFLTAEALLFAIVTEPRQGEVRRRAVILVNAGADYHIGASGMYVGLARRWARRGYIVLRMDLAGLGDSGTRSGRPAGEIFPPTALEDIRAAIDWVRSRYGVVDLTLAGVCSGAYHALRAAAAGLPVDRILMVNPENFFWKEGMSVKDMQMAELVRNPTMYRARLFSMAAWKRLTSGQVNLSYISRIYIYRALLAAESMMREIARFLRIQIPGDLGWDLEKIAKRGVQLVFVFARGEPGIDLLEILGGSSLKRIGQRCRVHIIDSADHVFSRSGPRAVLEKILSDELYTSTERTAPRRVELKRSS
jgi:pimeloyl-ACP methyl ester carboxylesterase